MKKLIIIGIVFATLAANAVPNDPPYNAPVPAYHGKRRILSGTRGKTAAKVHAPKVKKSIKK